MIVFLIGWLGIVAIVLCVCATVCYAIKMYYKNQKDIRLEQMDLNLQNPQLAADSLTVKKIAQSCQKNASYDALLLRDVRQEMLARNLISKDD